MRMRVVAGSAKGKRLLTVPGEGTRPIMDRVKTALFDVLRPRLAGMHVLDLFAGSGSVGIEALSQGAASCTFIERSDRAITTIRKNLAATGLADRAEVRRTNALHYLTGTTSVFDFIYVAPPQYQNLWVEALERIVERPEILRKPNALVIAQIDPKEYTTLDLGALRENRQKRYGNTLLVFYEPGDEEQSPSLA